MKGFIVNIMENLADIIDWLLRLVGIFTIIKGVISLIAYLFTKIEMYEDINIISDPSNSDLNSFTYYETFDECYNLSNESTLFAPYNNNLYSVSLYELKLNKYGRLKKHKRVYFKKKLEPNTTILFKIRRSCCAPSYMLEWKSLDGYTSNYLFQENNFNGNNSLKIIKYKSKLINTFFNYFV